MLKCPCSSSFFTLLFLVNALHHVSRFGRVASTHPPFLHICVDAVRKLGACSGGSHENMHISKAPVYCMSVCIRDSIIHVCMVQCALLVLVDHHPTHTTQRAFLLMSRLFKLFIILFDASVFFHTGSMPAQLRASLSFDI